MTERCNPTNPFTDVDRVSPRVTRRLISWDAADYARVVSKTRALPSAAFLR